MRSSTPFCKASPDVGSIPFVYHRQQRKFTRSHHELQHKLSVATQKHNRCPKPVSETAVLAESSSHAGSASRTNVSPYLSPQQQNAVQEALQKLNSEQQAALYARGRAVRITAGPGSGKTRVVTARVADLIARGVQPSQVLVITFTNKAAEELRERLGHMLGDAFTRTIKAGTFHSICNKILRRYIECMNCGRDSRFSIAGEDEQLDICKEVITQMLSNRNKESPDVNGNSSSSMSSSNVSRRLAPTTQEVSSSQQQTTLNKADLRQQEGLPDDTTIRRLARQLQGDISTIKNKVKTTYCVDQDELIKDACTRHKWIKQAASPNYGLWTEKSFAVMFDKYHRKLCRVNKLDFDDLLGLTVALLLTQPDVLQRLQQQYQHILVDEFQDTNVPQYELVKLLKGQTGNLYVVGDVNQAIYSWRGAVPENIEVNLVKDFPETETRSLRNNYRQRCDKFRSCPEILQAAGSALTMQRPAKQGDKYEPLVPIRKTKGHVEVCSTSNDKDEARTVAERMRRLHREGVPWREMAVLYRTRLQSRPFQEQLALAGIPFRVLGDSAFWEATEIKDILAYLQVVWAPAYDTFALERIINKPKRGIGKAAITNLQRLATKQDLTLSQLLLRDLQTLEGCMHGAQDISNVMDVKSAKLSSTAIQGLKDFRRLIASCRMRVLANVQEETLGTIMQYILNQVEYSQLLEKDENGEERYERLQTLMQLACDPESWAVDVPLDDASGVALKTPTSGNRLPLAEQLQAFLHHAALLGDAVDRKDLSKDVVTLTTLHQAKGLEWGVVVVAGCEEGRMPLMREDANGVARVSDIEEEHRLAYVGFTRAKDRLIVTYAKERKVFTKEGRPQSMPTSPSIFVHRLTALQLKLGVEGTPVSQGQIQDRPAGRYASRYRR